MGLSRHPRTVMFIDQAFHSGSDYHQHHPWSQSYQLALMWRKKSYNMFPKSWGPFFPMVISSRVHTHTPGKRSSSSDLQGYFKTYFWLLPRRQCSGDGPSSLFPRQPRPLFSMATGPSDRCGDIMLSRVSLKACWVRAGHSSWKLSHSSYSPHRPLPCPLLVALYGRQG